MNNLLRKHGLTEQEGELFWSFGLQLKILKKTVQKIIYMLYFY